jgi:hypothetical protein
MIGYYANGNAPPADLLLYDATGMLVALAEVKAIPGQTAEWAAEFRRNIASHGLPATRFYLMITPDRVFFWKDVTAVPEIIPPTWTVDALPLLNPYYSLLRVTPDDVDREVFRDIIHMWISDLENLRPGGSVGPELDWAVQSGFLSAVSAGHVRHAELVA